MKFRLIFPLVALTAAILACSNTFPFIWEEERRYSASTIMNLEVSPPSGTEDFTLDVTYEVYWIADKTIPSIDCIYTAPDGTTAEIGRTDTLRHIGTQGVETYTEVLPFFVPVKEDGSHAGIYIANCRSEDNRSTMSITFEVVREEKFTPILSVTNSPLIYNGTSQAAILQVANIPYGIVPGTVMNVLYNGSATVPVNAGTYAVTADFTPEDPDAFFTLTAAPAGNFVIGKAAPSLSVSNSPVPYDGSPHAAAVSASVPGSVSNVLTGGAANQTNVSSYVVTADFTPSDPTNFTSMTAAPAGDFVIQEAAPKALNKGKIIFDYAMVESSVPGAGSYAAEVTNLCIPEVNVADDGTVSGQCEQSGIRGHLVTSVNLTTMVIGQVDPSGKVTFTYEVSEIGLPNGSWRVDYSGSGTLTPDGKATGTADFAYTCNSGSENLFWCRIVPYKESLTSDAFSGTIPWTFEATP